MEWKMKCAWGLRVKRRLGVPKTIWLHQLYTTSLSLPLFPFVRGEVLPATCSPPQISDSLSTHPVSCLLLLVSLLSCLLHISLLIQSSHLSLDLSRLLLSCSRNSAAPVGSLSSAIISTCPAHCNRFLASLSDKLLCIPVSPFLACLPSLLLLFFGPSCFRTLTAFVVVARSVPRFPFRTDMPV